MSLGTNHFFVLSSVHLLLDLVYGHRLKVQAWYLADNEEVGKVTDNIIGVVLRNSHDQTRYLSREQSD